MADLKDSAANENRASSFPAPDEMSLFSIITYAMNIFNHTVFVVDSKGHFIYANDFTIKRFGLDHRNLRKHTVRDVYPFLTEELFKHYMSLASPHEGLNFEFFAKEKSGVLYPNDVTLIGIEYKGEKSLFVFAIDITKMKAEEYELVERSKMLEKISQRVEAISKNISDAVIFFESEELEVSWSNYVANELFGNKGESIVGKHCQEILIDCGNNCEACPIKKVFSHKEKITMELSATANRFFLLIAAPVDSGKDVSGAVVTIRDITNFKWSERTLNEINDKITMAIVASELVLWDYYYEKNFVFIEDQVQTLFLQSEMSFNYSGWENYIYQEDRTAVDNEIRRYIAGETAEVDIVFRFMSPNKGLRWVELTATSPVNADGSKKAQILGFLRDIHEEKNLELELRQAKEQAEESDKMKSSFLANMSHEIRTPLNAIVGFSGVVCDQSGILTPDQKEKYFNLIEKNANVLLTLFNDILDLTKIERNELTISKSPVFVNSIINDTCTIFSQYMNEKRKGHLYLKTHTPLPNEKAVIQADRARFSQVLNNLLTNAVKFTDRGGIEFGYEEPTGDSIRFFVKDTGSGIKPEAQDIIFEAFRQESTQIGKKFGGTGLGLAISKRITEMLGGTVSLKSETGKGSVFYLDFPFDTSQAGFTENPNDEASQFSPEDYDFTGKKILIVDDNDNNHLIISQLLVDTDCIIEDSYSGERALKTIKRKKDIDLVILELELPDISGFDFPEQARKIRPDLPILAMTSNNNREHCDRIKNADFAEVLFKPIRMRNLLPKTLIALNKTQ